MQVVSSVQWCRPSSCPPALEYPLSRQGISSVTLKGGCVPLSEGNLEVARLCNFHWGRVPVVKDVRFNF